MNSNVETGLQGVLHSCLMALLILVGSGSAEAQTVLRVVGNDAPPYRIIQGREFSGIYFDTIREIGKRLGVQIEFTEAPLKRALMMMETGQADVMVGPNKTPEREAFMVFSNAVFPAENKVFYVHPATPCITRYEDLQGKNIAVYRGAVYFDQFDQDPTLEKQEVGEYAVAIRRVEAKRNDAAIIPELQGDYLLKQLNITLTKCPYVVAGRPSYITIAKKSPALQLQAQIEAVMTALQADGTFTEILKRYK